MPTRLRRAYEEMGPPRRLCGAVGVGLQIVSVALDITRLKTTERARANLARYVAPNLGFVQLPALRGIEAIPGELTDHYDPRGKVMRLSDSSVQPSVAAAAIVAHELGHGVHQVLAAGNRRVTSFLGELLLPVASSFPIGQGRSANLDLYRGACVTTAISSQHCKVSLLALTTTRLSARGVPCTRSARESFDCSGQPLFPI